MKTHLAQALAAFLPAKEQTATAFAKAVGVHQVTISRLCTGDRPAVETLKAICTRWPDSKATLGLLVAHLRDEIERAGRSSAEIEINTQGVAEDDIHLLAREMKTDADLAAILHDFAKMIRGHKAALAAARTYPEPTDQFPAAAEDPSSITPPSHAAEVKGLAAAAREALTAVPPPKPPAAPEPKPAGPATDKP